MRVEEKLGALFGKSENERTSMKTKETGRTQRKSMNTKCCLKGIGETQNNS